MPEITDGLKLRYTVEPRLIGYGIYDNLEKAFIQQLYNSRKYAKQTLETLFELRFLKQIKYKGV